MSGSSIFVTGIEQKAAWNQKSLPPVERICEGVWSIPVPFPNPLRYTLSYLLAGPGDVVLVDPGWDSDQGWEHLIAGLRRAGVKMADVNGVVVTHFHLDHSGLAGRVADASGAWIAWGEHEVLSRGDTETRRVQVESDRRRLRIWGVPESILAAVAMTDGDALAFENLRGADVKLAHGSLAPAAGHQLRVVTTPGHSPGHICLVDETRGLIFSGDHVLPRISPHIALTQPGPANPLRDYFDSLSLTEFDDDMEVCPAHEYRFIGMRRRVDELIAHNRQRSAEVLQVISRWTPTNVWDVARRLTWSRGWDSLQGNSLRFALSETASHLAFLYAEGYEARIPVRG